MSEWISVDDRLPDTSTKFKEGDYVLCRAGDGVPFVAWYNEPMDRWTVSHHYASSEAAAVTHWQPLPEPPNP